MHVLFILRYSVSNLFDTYFLESFWIRQVYGTYLGTYILAGCTSICYCQSQHHSSAKIYPSSESGQRILIDNQSGLIDSLTTAKIQLVGPILPILEAETSQDRVFILSEQKNESLSPYQYQSDISIEDGLPLRLARLADFENVPCTTSESNGIRLTK